MYSSMNYNICIGSCSHNQNQHPEELHHTKELSLKLLLRGHTYPPNPSSQPLNFSPPLQVCLFKNGILECVTFGDLPSFAQQNAFGIHPSCFVYQQFIPFYCRVGLHCRDVPHFIYFFTWEGHLGYFQFGVIMNRD